MNVVAGIAVVAVRGAGARRVDAVPHREARRAPAGGVRVRVERRVGERAEEERTEVVRASPPVGDVGGFADVEVHLHRRGVAHHGASGGPPGVEVLLHRAVAGRAEHPVARSGRVEAGSHQRDAERFDRGTRRGGVGGHRVDRGGEAGRGGAAQLELPTRLEGQPARAGQRIRERGPERVGRHGPLGVADGDPLELDAHPAGRARGEHPGGDVRRHVVAREGAGGRRHGYRCP